MPEEEVKIDIEPRKRIFDFIRESPGVHLREIQRRLEIPLGTVEYHVNWLMQEQLIGMKEDGHYKRYYPSGEIRSEERELLSILRQEIPRKIVIEILRAPGTNFGTLARKFEVAPSTLSFHLSKLVDRVVVAKKKVGRESAYTVNNPEEVARVIIMYKRTFLDALVEDFSRTWSELQP